MLLQDIVRTRTTKGEGTLDQLKLSKTYTRYLRDVIHIYYNRSYFMEIEWMRKTGGVKRRLKKVRSKAVPRLTCISLWTYLSAVVLIATNAKQNQYSNEWKVLIEWHLCGKPGKECSRLWRSVHRHVVQLDCERPRANWKMLSEEIIEMWSSSFTCQPRTGSSWSGHWVCSRYTDKA